jgi:Zn-dependent protease
VLLNLFNLLPVPPLDGGRITAALNPKIWMLGVGGLVAMIVNEIRQGRSAFLLILVLVFAMPRVLSTLRGRSKDDPYYQISKAATWTIGVLYVGLGVLLIAMYWLTKDVLTQLS